LWGDKLDQLKNEVCELRERVRQLEMLVYKEKRERNARDAFINSLLDEDKLTITVSGETVRLTPVEYRFMRLLLENREFFCSYEEISKKTYGCENIKYIGNSLRCMKTRLNYKLKGLVEIKTVNKKGIYIAAIKGYGKGKQLLRQTHL
jgi:DNA-binding response OmpR family regulator